VSIGWAAMEKKSMVCRYSISTVLEMTFSCKLRVGRGPPLGSAPD
jgi:hypothetical protein